jgi:hypothetical protein
MVKGKNGLPKLKGVSAGLNTSFRSPFFAIQGTSSRALNPCAPGHIRLACRIADPIPINRARGSSKPPSACRLPSNCEAGSNR